MNRNVFINNKSLLIAFGLLIPLFVIAGIVFGLSIRGREGETVEPTTVATSTPTPSFTPTPTSTQTPVPSNTATPSPTPTPTSIPATTFVVKQTWPEGKSVGEYHIKIPKYLLNGVTTQYKSDKQRHLVFTGDGFELGMYSELEDVRDQYEELPEVVTILNPSVKGIEKNGVIYRIRRDNEITGEISYEYGTYYDEQCDNGNWPACGFSSLDMYGESFGVFFVYCYATPQTVNQCDALVKAARFSQHKY